MIVIIGRILRYFFKWILILPLLIIALIFLLWSFGALYYQLPLVESAQVGCGLIFVGIYVGVLLFAPRYFREGILICMILGVMIWFGSIKPNPDTNYQQNWAIAPKFTFDGNLVTIENIRDFHYRTETDYDVRYRTETFDISKAKQLSLAVSHWDGLQAIGHTMLSFEFEDDKYITISVETRVPEGVESGSLPGMFKKFGLIMLFGTESDLLKLRSTYRGETLFLYPTTATPEATSLVFERFCRRGAQLSEKPEFYNTLYSNCTTELIPPLSPILFDFEFNWHIILNGTIDALAKKMGYIDTEEDKSSNIVKAGIKGEGNVYSKALRKSLKSYNKSSEN